MKSDWLVVLLLVLFACGQENSPKDDTPPAIPPPAPAPEVIMEGGQASFSPQDPFIQQYTGNIGGKYPIDMLLMHWGDGFLTGHFSYKKTNKRILLQGEMNLNEVVELQAYLADKPIDKFTFSFQDLEKIKGTWFLPSTKNTLDFELHAINSETEQSKKWAGGWYLNGIWDGGHLLIGDVRDTAFYFALSVVRNGHIGELDGEANISGDSALFNEVLDFGMEGEDACVLKFKVQADHIMVEQGSSPFACGFGMRAYVDGRYDNESVKVEPLLTFGDDGVFSNAAQHDQFKEWIGEEHYRDIAFNMQVINTEEYHSEPDQIHGRLSEGVVMGLLTTNEAIILHDGQSAYWAATIYFDEDPNADPMVLYFTNQKKWQDKMPTVFERWREPFSDYRVINKFIQPSPSS